MASKTHSVRPGSELSNGESWCLCDERTTAGQLASGLSEGVQHRNHTLSTAPHSTTASQPRPTTAPQPRPVAPRPRLRSLRSRRTVASGGSSHRAHVWRFVSLDTVRGPGTFVDHRIEQSPESARLETSKIAHRGPIGSRGRGSSSLMSAAIESIVSTVSGVVARTSVTYSRMASSRSKSRSSVRLFGWSHM